MKKVVLAVLLASSVCGTSSAVAVEEAQSLAAVLINQEPLKPWLTKEKEKPAKVESETVYVNHKSMEKLNSQVEAMGLSVNEQLSRKIEKQLGF